MDETWKPIPGYEGEYDVSDLGRIRNARTGKIKKPTFSRHEGRYFVLLWRHNKYRNFKVHRLVLLAFKGPCPEGMEGCHNNGDSTDNRLLNLRWDTPANNHADKIAHGTTNRGERCGTHKLTLEQVRAIREDSRPQKDIAKDYGVLPNTISRIKTGARWQHCA